MIDFKLSSNHENNHGNEFIIPKLYEIVVSHMIIGPLIKIQFLLCLPSLDQGISIVVILNLLALFDLES